MVLWYKLLIKTLNNECEYKILMNKLFLVSGPRSKMGGKGEFE